ncbi:MAG: universal stress protein [Gemmatimonadetes bacterium]|nr:universal stress protein [Gemmatimonadota bacterium]
MRDAHAPAGSRRPGFGPIVVATDLSEGSDELLRSAAQVAARSGSPLHVVHAVDMVPGAGGSYDEEVRRAERLLDERIRAVVAPDVAVHPHVESSPPDRAIIGWADRVDSGLIVVGPHVRRGGPAGLLGSTAERVLGDARVPCLVVRAPVAAPASHVVAAVDPAHTLAPVLDAAIQWTLLFSDAGEGGGVPMVSALYVTGDRRGEPPPALGEALRLALSRADAGDRLTAQIALRGTDVVQSILLFAEVEATDLLVLSTRNRGVVGRALLGSVSAEVTRRAPCNVLLIPPAAE